ncbi:hypothetical protein MferCBS31731_002792 [Microsporum ferrugineum]
MGKNYDSRPRHGGGGQGNAATSKPPLTHFLCIPLVNKASIYQLDSSLAEFKSSILLVPPSGSAAGHAPDTPLVPYGALRPLGTLHFTLGVMSLTTQERLSEALSFFRSLDLALIMQEAELEAKPRQTFHKDSLGEPLSIDLVSLHALPKVRSATILHASPLDNTGRLYPFCVKLRDRFIEAGFMHRDMIKANPRNKTASGRESIYRGESSRNNGLSTQAKDTTEGNGGQEGDTASSIQAADPSVIESKPRPLLLHATIANTIYLGKRRGTAQQGGRGSRGKEKSVFTFDATELLEMFAGSQPKPHHTIVSKDAKGKETQTAHEPFNWAKDIPIDRICICEMGAKTVPHDEEKGGPVLGQEYRIIEQRKLDFQV